MALSEYRHGALIVVQDLPDRNDLVRALKQIDERLFIEKQLTLEQEQVWCVVVDIGRDEPPVTILEYRSKGGIPLQLDSGIIERTAQMERDGGRLHQRVIDRNRQFQAEKRAKMREDVAEITKDRIPSIEGRSSWPIPRSQSLRMSRDKQRAKGHKV